MIAMMIAAFSLFSRWHTGYHRARPMTMTAAAIKPSRAHSAVRVGSKGKSEPGSVSMSPNGFSSTRSDYKQGCPASRSAVAHLVRALRGLLTLATTGTTVNKRIVTLLAAASLWVAVCADVVYGKWPDLRTVTGGFLVGAVVPEPADVAFLGAGLLILLKGRAH